MELDELTIALEEDDDAEDVDTFAGVEGAE